MNISIDIPERILKSLKGRAQSEAKPVEETILDILLAQEGLEDPETKAEMHLKLSEKYLPEGEELLAGQDYIQASEKFWGAAAQALKVAAAKRGEELQSHNELHKYALKLSREAGDPELSKLWRSAIVLHQNFYEAWLPNDLAKEAMEDVKRFIEKVKEL